MKTLTTRVLALTAASLLALTACGSNDSTAKSEAETLVSSAATAHADHANHPADGGPAPAGIAEATDPTYPVGTEVVLAADHMSGMDGATATVVGAYQTYTYSVNYTPTDGSAPVTDHKWVVQEELADVGSERLADGTPVTIEAEHMAGMKGAEGTIESSTDETVYMVDFTAGGMTMKNHKWVTESEIKAAK
ncbi:YdhK family protein [Rothia nasimurium]|uniref:YdhK family protein n=1 Tax=Rothia nasimurium TaxID=85336 RepID=UPI001F295AB4|nr:YdhK family protein [Rothia nasimurium]